MQKLAQAEIKTTETNTTKEQDNKINLESLKQIKINHMNNPELQGEQRDRVLKIISTKEDAIISNEKK